MMGGTLSTAGGVVFSGNLRGDVLAFDAKTGKVVWRFHAGGGVRSQPIAYQIDGRTYVAIPTGASARSIRSPRAYECSRRRNVVRLRPSQVSRRCAEGFAPPSF